MPGRDAQRLPRRGLYRAGADRRLVRPAAAGTPSPAPGEQEVSLTGGRLTSGVVRVGDTVRRPTGPHSPFVHRLLRHLEAAGFEAAPRVMGVDERGREVLSFIAGWVPPNLDHFADETLAAAARLLRQLRTTRPPARARRRPRRRLPQRPVSMQLRLRRRSPRRVHRLRPCHPRRPGCVTSPSGWLWTLSADDGPPVPEQAQRLRLMADAYGLPDPSVLLDAVLVRQRENLAAARTRSRSPDSAVAEYGRASATWQREQMAWLREHADAFRAALTTDATRPGG